MRTPSNIIKRIISRSESYLKTTKSRAHTHTQKKNSVKKRLLTSFSCIHRMLSFLKSKLTPRIFRKVTPGLTWKAPAAGGGRSGPLGEVFRASCAQHRLPRSPSDRTLLATLGGRRKLWTVAAGLHPLHMGGGLSRRPWGDVPHQIK